MTASRRDETTTSIVERLRLAPHPEGGWFRETWRTAPRDNERADATAILFLLEAHQRSHWHRVDADELWLWHAGAALTLSLAASASGPVVDVIVGPDVLGGENPQALVPAHSWQAAKPRGGWVLVSCVVSPGFEFSGFELAAEDWRPG